jgi:hypothetical protein
LLPNVTKFEQKFKQKKNIIFFKLKGFFTRFDKFKKLFAIFFCLESRQHKLLKIVFGGLWTYRAEKRTKIAQTTYLGLFRALCLTFFLRFPKVEAEKKD